MSASSRTPTPTAVMSARPGYEGANIRTWVGFKHFMYLAEGAVLAWFRERGFGPGRLFHDFGLGLEVVDSSVQLPSVLDVDDEVRAEASRSGARRFTVRLAVRHDGGERTVLRGKLVVALIRERAAEAWRPVPAEFADLEYPDLASAAAADRSVGQPEPPDPGWGDGGDFVWSTRVPYYHCHFTERMQHSAYVRMLEEVVDRFLAHRGLAVGRLLAERSWIPVVSRARVTQLAPVYMEDRLHTGFAVDEVLRDTMFAGRMDCHVEREGRLVHAATASILHGYAISAGPAAGQLAPLSEVATILLGGRP